MTTNVFALVEIDTANLNEVDRPVYEWLTQRFGAAPLQFKRLLRWRLGWEATVIIDGVPTGVLVRATRGEGFRAPIPLDLEARLHDVMEQHGVRAPHVYGMIDKPFAMVMERLEGGINTELIADADAQWKVRAEYIEMLARLHAIPVEEFAKAGLSLPTTPNRGSLEYYQGHITAMRNHLAPRSLPFLEFLDKWLVNNAPQHRDRVGLVTADSGQFMYEGDRMTGLIDFELAYIGDPAAEFAGMRVRDTNEPLGDIGRLRDLYEQLTGDHIDRKLIAYHSAGFVGSAGLLTFPMAYDCEPDVDYVAYLHFSICMVRWGLQGVFECMDMEQQPITPPRQNPTLPFSGATKQLKALMTGWKTDDKALIYHFEGAAALATYLDRCLVYGQDILESDLADIQALIGHKVSTREEADHALAAWIRDAGQEHEPALARLFDRWLQRQSFLLEGCGSQAHLTECTLQPIARRADDGEA